MPNERPKFKSIKTIGLSAGLQRNEHRNCVKAIRFLKGLEQPSLFGIGQYVLYSTLFSGPESTVCQPQS